MKNFVQKGDNLQFTDSQLTKPSTRVASGDPVVVGRISGVANTTAKASTDLVVVSTRGVYLLSVNCQRHAMPVGETCYIDPVTAALTDDPTKTPFGIVLDPVASLATTIVRVKLLQASPGATGFFS